MNEIFSNMSDKPKFTDEISRLNPNSTLEGDNNPEHVIRQENDIQFPRFDEGTNPINQRLSELTELQSANWENLNSEQRLESLTQLETTMAEFQNRPKCEIVAESLSPDDCGSYCYGTNTITVNMTHIIAPEKRMEVIDTIIHEGYHAYQWHAIQKPGVHPDRLQVEEWRANFQPGAYITPDDTFFGYEDYHNQPVERDAWAYAREKCRIFA